MFGFITIVLGFLMIILLMIESMKFKELSGMATDLLVVMYIAIVMLATGVVAFENDSPVNNVIKMFSFGAIWTSFMLYLMIPVVKKCTLKNEVK